MSAPVAERNLSGLVMTDLFVLVCGSCGGIYAIHERVRKEHEVHGTCWNCPYCRISWGYGKSQIKILEEKLAAERALRVRAVESAHKRAEWAEQETRIVTRRLAAQKGQNTKMRKRVANGVCPCCKRTFVNLHRHMNTKHPGFVEGA